MYLRITKTLLEGIPKKHLLKLFRVPSSSAKLTKKDLVTQVLKVHTRNHGSVTLYPYLLICEYCGMSFTMSASAFPSYCTNCGKTSPYLAFERNLQRTAVLVEIASDLNAHQEPDSRSILLEQALVTVITSFEVLLRDVYSLVIDHKHVVFGESIYPRVYSGTRNEFLGLGSAAAKFRKDLGLNLKQKLGTSNFAFLSRMFSARHIIVHNCSIKDADYIGQTGEPLSNLNSKLSLNVRDVIRLTLIAKRVGLLGERLLRQCILDHHRKQTDLMVLLSDRISSSGSKRRKGRTRDPFTIRTSRMLL